MNQDRYLTHSSTTRNAENGSQAMLIYDHMIAMLIDDHLRVMLIYDHMSAMLIDDHMRAMLIYDPITIYFW